MKNRGTNSIADVSTDQSVADPWQRRVDSGDWDAITAEIDEYGGALLPQLLTPGEAEQIRGLYEQDTRFRSTVDMGRHRFGEGQYRYFATPYPEPVERLKQALYPRLLPIARGGYTRQRVFFADEATAVAAGYRPCAACCRDRYDAWKAARNLRCGRRVAHAQKSGPNASVNMAFHSSWARVVSQ